MVYQFQKPQCENTSRNANYSTLLHVIRSDSNIAGLVEVAEVPTDLDIFNEVMNAAIDNADSEMTMKMTTK